MKLHPSQTSANKMTIENLFTYPLAAPLPDMMHEALTRQIPVAQRTRNHSGGSTGSQGSASSYGSDSKTALTSSMIRQELLAYHLSQVQLHGAVPTRPMSASTVQNQQQPRLERVASATTTPTERSLSTSGQKNVNPTRYKTEMCRPFEESGHCKYGDKCQFAHGRHELRNLSRHPKYKTELCRTYHTVGFCPYGPRCHFVHNEDELKLSEINTLKQHQVMKQVAQQVSQQQQVLSKMALQPQMLSEVPSKVTYITQQQIPRPQTLDFTSLSSVFDSPPASVSDASSPSLSPTSMMSDDVFSSSASSTTSSIPTPPPGFSALPASNNTMFSFPSAFPASRVSPAEDSVASLAAGLQATVLSAPTTRDSDLFTPPLSVDSDESWSSDSDAAAKGLRLPIFNMLATFSEIN